MNLDYNNIDLYYLLCFIYKKGFLVSQKTYFTNSNDFIQNSFIFYFLSKVITNKINFN